MYWQIDAICFFLGIWICVSSPIYLDSFLYIALGVVWIWVYPIILETIYNFYAVLF